jgi:phosphoserine phosphatase
MAIIDAQRVQAHDHGVEVFLPFDPRKIKVAFHDIDGTFSTIREWEPVMSATLAYVIRFGMPASVEEAFSYVCGHIEELRTGEGDRFCIESAGLSALTQMEWALRRSLQDGTLTDAPQIDSEEDRRSNDEIVRRIWAGEEDYESLETSVDRQAYMRRRTPDLFRLYERVLYDACRNRNLAEARINPGRFQIKGGIRFLEHLKHCGITSYFVTGSVVEHDANGKPHGGIYEEVVSIGIPIGPGLLVEDICGSAFDHKKPKPEVMEELARQLGIPGEEILVVGDGRSEIAAGKKLGAVCISRLNRDSLRQREIHRGLGTNMILDDYDKPSLLAMITEGE